MKGVADLSVPQAGCAILWPKACPPVGRAFLSLPSNGDQPIELSVRRWKGALGA